MLATRNIKTGVVLIAFLAGASFANPNESYPVRYDLGAPVSEDRLEKLLTAIPPDGEGLPNGEGAFDDGKSIYEAKCAGCHGVDLAGTPAARPLIGGRQSLTTSGPLPTVESYWPYATSVFSYVRNTMPTTAPGSLTNAEVYSLLAYILASADIIEKGQAMNKDSLPAVIMPNRNGFIPDPRPDVANTR